MSSDSLIHALAGAGGGIVAMSATYPLVFLSTRAAMETKKENKARPSPFPSTEEFHVNMWEPELAASTYQAVIDIIKREGVLGLYSGLSSSLLGITVTNGIYYYFYERSKGIIVKSRPGGKGLSAVESIIAGLIAGSATTIISNPIWVIQTSQAVRTMDSSPSLPRPTPGPGKDQRRLGMIETTAHLLSTGGPAVFWRGIGPALVLVANPVLQYTVFEQLKNLLVRRRHARVGKGASAGSLLSDWDFFILGALSKLVATSTTYPYIVVKSRLQAGHAHAERYRSAIDGLRTIVREEGIEGLYKGAGSKLLQSVLTAAILFAGQRRFYEITKQVLSPALKA